MATLSPDQAVFFVSFALILLQYLHFAESQSYIGINYGQVADNLPPPSETVKLLQSTSIQNVRLYGADPTIISALANTGISIFIATTNAEIQMLASDPTAADQWITSNVLPFYPNSSITTISVGNEVFYSNNKLLISQLVPAMKNLQRALDSNPTLSGGKVKITTVHSLALLKRSEPPSSAIFHPSFLDTIKELLQFHEDTESPFAINPYPFFGYRADPKPETLAYCLFQPNPGRFDPATNITYTNMFDAQVDAVRSALNGLGFSKVELVVAETGWPYHGDSNEVGVSVDNAKAYNGGLVAHLRSMAGTPLMPGKPINTYLFALYDEDLKPGPSSERSFGLFRPDLSVTYDVGLTKSSSQTPISTPITTGGQWCVPKAGTPEDVLQENLDYACGQGIDCSSIQVGGSCYAPNDVASHAAFAMNLLYQTSGRNPWNCDFKQTAIVTYSDPSHEGCIYPGS